ncbi:MAG: TPM domain-containing protein [Hyphomicrobiales bacterium]|nr:TPM domain-containing protein [Hyphomicrobiales bacterium]
MSDRSASPAGFRQRLKLLLAALCLGLTVLTTGAQAADPTFPALSGRVVDAARILNPAAIQRISDKLAAHEMATSDQVVVATVPKLDDLTIEDYGNRLYRRWALGTKDRNNGALLLIAPTERKIRIEVGYGLEGALTDALSKTIITTAITPKLRTGDFAGGIEAGVDAIIDVLKGDAEQWQRRPQLRSDGEDPYAPAIIALFVLIVVLIVIVQSRQAGRSGPARYHRTRDGRWIMLPGTPSGGWSGGSGSGGGFSGGGGSSGGGGASGDW